MNPKFCARHTAYPLYMGSEDMRVENTEKSPVFAQFTNVAYRNGAIGAFKSYNYVIAIGRYYVKYI